MFKKTKSIQDFFHKLSHVYAVQTKSKSLSKTGWNGTGTGNVSTARLDKHTLIFTEQGSWKSINGSDFKFKNIYKWMLGKNSISVSHLRQGPEFPVFLGELIPHGDILQSSSPHICIKDKYSASLTAVGSNLSLVWRVLGPSKNERIEYLYITNPELT